MATIARVTTWASAQVLTAADLNGEFNNVINTWNNHNSATSTWANVRATVLGVGANAITGTANVQMGTGTGNSEIVGTANINTASVGTGADTTEDTLHTYTMPANSLSANGKAVRITCHGRFAANANTKQIRLYFGAQNIYNSSLAVFNNQAYFIQAYVIRIGASTHRSFAWSWTGTGSTTSSGINFSNPTDDSTASIIIKATGTNGTATANDSIEDFFHVEFIN